MDILQSPIHRQQELMMSAAMLQMQAVDWLGFNREE